MFCIREKICSKRQQTGLPVVMGILNVTPDSFSDGGAFVTQQAMASHVNKLVSDGADLIDVGGESTRPGAKPVALSEELERVIPVVEWIAERFDVVISIDTYKPEVMKEAISAGAKLVNDVNALCASGAVDVVAQSGASVCLMHKQGSFERMQEAPVYGNVVSEVTHFLLDRVKECEQAGISARNIVLDPGFGFGKTLQHNKTLFQHLGVLSALGYPVLVGVSRKRMIMDVLHTSALDDRIQGSVTAAVLAVLKGAQIVRVHDVKETVMALTVARHLA